MSRQCRSYRILAVLAAPLMSVGLLMSAGVPASAVSSCESWTGTQPPSPGTTDNELQAVAMLPPCNVWAVGFDNSGGADQTLIVHWNGTAWTQLPSPSPGSVFSDLFGISAVSATSIWAVGDNSDGTDQTLILHWNGTTWKQVPSPSPGSKADDLLGVSATSSSNAWVVGLFSNGGPNQALALHCC